MPMEFAAPRKHARGVFESLGRRERCRVDRADSIWWTAGPDHRPTVSSDVSAESLRYHSDRIGDIGTEVQPHSGTGRGHNSQWPFRVHLRYRSGEVLDGGGRDAAADQDKFAGAAPQGSKQHARGQQRRRHLGVDADHDLAGLQRLLQFAPRAAGCSLGKQKAARMLKRHGHRPRRRSPLPGRHP